MFDGKIAPDSCVLLVTEVKWYERCSRDGSLTPFENTLTEVVPMESVEMAKDQLLQDDRYVVVSFKVFTLNPPTEHEVPGQMVPAPQPCHCAYCD